MSNVQIDSRNMKLQLSSSFFGYHNFFLAIQNFSVVGYISLEHCSSATKLFCIGYNRLFGGNWFVENAAGRKERL